MTLLRNAFCFVSLSCLQNGCGARSGLSQDKVLSEGPVGATGATLGGLGGTSSVMRASGGTLSISTDSMAGNSTSLGGSSSGGMIGLGGATTLPTPKAISVGSFHSCTLLDDGTIHCWGSNEKGRLGDGSYDNRPFPMPVTGITSATAIDCGGQHVCALLSDKSVRCWGSNDFGQLGDGSTIGSPEPVRVNDLENVTSISSGYQHTCALLGDASIWCWGANDLGQLGSKPATSVPQPIEVDGIGPALAIAAGRAHTCALLDDSVRSVVCWGANSEAQLGVPATSIWSEMTTVADLTGTIAIAAGSQHNCAITRDAVGAHAVQCWGWNYYGQLGDDSPDAITGTPSGLATAISVSAADHSCSVLQDGRVRCWGFNRSGELGNGTAVDTSVPQFVVGISDATSVAAGSVHSCALLTSGRVKCWGDNSSGELGDGSTHDSSIPVSVAGL